MNFNLEKKLHLVVYHVAPQSSSFKVVGIIFWKECMYIVKSAVSSTWQMIAFPGEFLEGCSSLELYIACAR